MKKNRQALQATVASARLMLAAFFVWLELPALSSAPHLLGAHFSCKGLSLTGPGSACAMADLANNARTMPEMMDRYVASPPP